MNSNLKDEMEKLRSENASIAAAAKYSHDKLNQMIYNAGELIAAADSACDWLCQCPPGTDQRERGDKLRDVLDRMAKKASKH